MTMRASLENGLLEEKTIAFCREIVALPDFEEFRQSIDAFLEDAEAQRLYREAAVQGEQLYVKQRAGLTISDEELSAYEAKRQALLQNEKAVRFLQAQETFREVQNLVLRYITKTMELGRVPTSEDLYDCGEGCSCGM